MLLVTQHPTPPPFFLSSKEPVCVYLQPARNLKFGRITQTSVKVRKLIAGGGDKLRFTQQRIQFSNTCRPPSSSSNQEAPYKADLLSFLISFGLSALHRCQYDRVYRVLEDFFGRFNIEHTGLRGFFWEKQVHLLEISSILGENNFDQEISGRKKIKLNAGHPVKTYVRECGFEK